MTEAHTLGAADTNWPQMPPASNGYAASVGTHQVQATAEGVHLPPAEGEVDGGGRKVEFLGAWFRIAPKVGLMPLLAFANASKRGVDSADMEGLAALYAVIKDCVDGGDWARFEQHAIDAKADDKDLLGLVQRVIEMLSARPQSPPGISSAGRPPTSENSKESSSSPATVHHPELTSVDSLLAHSTP